MSNPITSDEIRNVIDYLRTGGRLTPRETQILSSLRIGIDRGEFDGSLESAENCLQEADWEIDSDAETEPRSQTDIYLNLK